MSAPKEVLAMERLSPLLALVRGLIDQAARLEIDYAHAHEIAWLVRLSSCRPTSRGDSLLGLAGDSGTFVLSGRNLALGMRWKVTVEQDLVLE